MTKDADPTPEQALDEARQQLSDAVPAAIETLRDIAKHGQRKKDRDAARKALEQRGIAVEPGVEA